MTKRPLTIDNYQDLGPGAADIPADAPLTYPERLAANGDMFHTKPFRTLTGWIAFDKQRCTFVMVRRHAMFEQ